MSKFFIFYITAAWLVYFLAPTVVCLNTGSFLEQKYTRLVTMLRNLETDLTGIFSIIPFHRLHPIRVIVDPLFEFIGNAVESSAMTSTRRCVGKFDKVQFDLYSDKRNNTRNWRLVPDDDTSISNAIFTEARPIKILIHGFQAAGSYEFPQKTKNAYLQYTNFNAITVDWGPLAFAPINLFRAAATYPSAVHNTKFVSQRITDLIVSLFKNGVIKSPNEIHLIGFSLGAHVAGQVGYRTHQRLGSKIGRITALEPASPLLETSTMEMRIDKSDATFVDVMHSSYLSMYHGIGHADFYPNGGRNQAECYDGIRAIENPIQAISDFRTQCSHEYAYELFTFSIENKKLIGCSCSSWANYRGFCRHECHIQAVMGEFCSSSTRGSFFLETKLPVGFSINTFGP